MTKKVCYISMQNVYFLSVASQAIEIKHFSSSTKGAPSFCRVCIAPLVRVVLWAAAANE